MSKGHDKKELNFELDLLPVISMMSVCICFLLLTAVWTQIGSVNINQGLGQEPIRQDSKASSVWITMYSSASSGQNFGQNSGQSSSQNSGAEVKIKMMDSPSVPQALQEKRFSLGSSGSGWAQIDHHTEALKRALPGLKTALIMPDSRVNYGDVIRVMDRLKILDIGEIGIAPL